MRIKTLAIIITLLMAANLFAGKFVVTDVEYLKGEDFVQLHFVANALIPIPDLFYPDDSNQRVVVMRIPDVQFNVEKESYKFDSPVIDSVNITKNDKFVDVRIELGDKVNYRVFTNQEGLFIEFPDMKRSDTIVARNENKKKEIKKETKKEIEAEPALAANKKSVTTANTAPPPVVSPPPVQTAALPSEHLGISIIKDFRLVDKDKNGVKFEFILSGPVEYNVIPIPQSPVRLAIDFKNTRSNRINKDINYLNVNKIRGAFNSPTIYRVVFDLEYLKNYHVSFNDENNILAVEFFNSSEEHQEKSKLKAKEQRTILARRQKEKKKRTEVPSSSTEGEKVMSTPGMEPALPTESVTETPVKTETGNINPGEKNVESVAEKQVRPLIDNSSLENNDFFAEEKSRVTNTSLSALEGGAWDDQESQDTEESSQLSFLTQTIAGGEIQYKGEPMDFDFKNADLENVLLFFAKVSGLSVVIDPGVTGTVTARMYQVPWDQALQYFLKVNGLDMIKEGNLLRIGKVSVLSNEAQARRKLKESRQMEVDLVHATRTLSYAKVSEIAPILRKQLSTRGEILEDKRSNTLIISEVPEKLELLDKLINTLDAANPQVSVEARIVEAQSNYTKNLGIQWGYYAAMDSVYGNQTSLKFPNSIIMEGNHLGDALIGPSGGYAINLPASGPNSGGVFSFGNVANTFRLDVALSSMESKGKGRIISAPKTTTQNNMEALIRQGKSIPVPTIQNNTLQVRYVPAALELKVTPQITAKGTIIMELEIKNNAPDFANQVLGIPPITTQTIKTVVMVDDGGTIVIGGIYRIEAADSTDRTPLLANIPLLGKLFKNSNAKSEQKELLVFITPKIIK
jgi:type IV pilus secretin PilQ/predicted competence protein